MSSEKTRETQYQREIDLKDEIGLASLGLMTNQVWYDDPKRLLFILARYKFVAKMLSGKDRVLEVGCGDGFASRIVAQAVGRLCLIDWDPVFIKDANARAQGRWTMDCCVHDILNAPVQGPYAAAYAVDVIEHIPKEKEDIFMANILRSLDDNGVLILGTPSIQSQAYASSQSQEGHVNCKDEKGLRGLMARYFREVFIFSMNDEVVHTGFYPMAHYLFAIGVGKL